MWQRYICYGLVYALNDMFKIWTIFVLSCICDRDAYGFELVYELVYALNYMLRCDSVYMFWGSVWPIVFSVLKTKNWGHGN